MLLPFLVARYFAARYSPIADCDEVFNYYEPTHFLTHGTGFQTWEWSPEYAIRSWSYLAGGHYVVIKAGQLLGLEGPALFFLLRYALGAVEALCEYYLYRVLSKRYQSLAGPFAILSMFAAGLFHASVSYLPSTFAMNTVTVAVALFIDDPIGNIVQILSCIALGAILGWPFVGVLGVPFGLYYLWHHTVTGDWLIAAFQTFVNAAAASTCVLVADTLILGRITFVPFNILNYNVFSASAESGPNIFGTEPWTYYLANLVLNFNILVPLAPLVLFVSPYKRITFALTPLFLWLGIMFAIPHKEERFLYVVYPLIPLAGAATLAGVFSGLQKYTQLPRNALYFVVCACALLSFGRSKALVSYYSAPFKVYDNIPASSTVCLGREWYRFPSSYFTDARVEFIPSGFNGLLPGHFKDPRAIPPGMNNRNEFDPSKLVDISECDYVVDIDMDASSVDAFDPRDQGWEKDVCARFFDAENSSGYSRLVYFGVDETPLGNTTWVDYCRYKRVD